MRGRGFSAVARGGALAALAIALLAATTPGGRQKLASAGERLGDLADQGLRTLQGRTRTRHGRRMEALEEMSGSIDAATTQWEAAMAVSKVLGELAEAPRLRGRPVAVRLIGGILHLEGEVRSEEEKALAGEIARRASGAQLIANDLTVTPLVR